MLFDKPANHVRNKENSANHDNVKGDVPYYIRRLRQTDELSHHKGRSDDGAENKHHDNQEIRESEFFFHQWLMLVLL